MGFYHRVVMAADRRAESARLVWMGALCVGFSLAGCRSREDEIVKAQPAPQHSAQRAPAAPIDHLAPDELASGSALAFGFSIPERLRIERAFPDAVHASGDVTLGALVKYVQSRVLASHVESGPARAVFHNAKIVGGPADHLYRFEMVSEGPRSLLVIRDMTPPPVVQGLSQAERWRRAGMSPDGKPLNPKQIQ